MPVIAETSGAHVITFVFCSKVFCFYLLFVVESRYAESNWEFIEPGNSDYLAQSYICWLVVWSSFCCKWNPPKRICLITLNKWFAFSEKFQKNNFIIVMNSCPLSSLIWKYQKIWEIGRITMATVRPLYGHDTAPTWPRYDHYTASAAPSCLLMGY